VMAAATEDKCRKLLSQSTTDTWIRQTKSWVRQSVDNHWRHRQLWLSLSTGAAQSVDRCTTRELGLCSLSTNPSWLSTITGFWQFSYRILISFLIWIQSCWFLFLREISTCIKRGIVPIDRNLNWLINKISLFFGSRTRQLPNLIKSVFLVFCLIYLSCCVCDYFVAYSGVCTRPPTCP